LRVLPPSRATNFYVAKSRHRFYFLQRENLLHAQVVIRATNNVNLQRNIVAQQVARKRFSYYWAFIPLLKGLKKTFVLSANSFFNDRRNNQKQSPLYQSIRYNTQIVQQTNQKSKKT